MQIILHFFRKKRERNEKKSRSSFFCSATRTRTGVYGVRGRCPRPLDDSTEAIYDLTIYDVRLAVISKAGAKVLLFFDIRKYFEKKIMF